METKHTEWAYDNATEEEGIGLIFVNFDTTKEKKIADVYGDTPEQTESLSRLIAAAPKTAAERDNLKAIKADLLEACRETFKHLSGTYQDGLARNRCRILLHGAISKANPE